MSLPKINQPIYSHPLEGLGKTIKFRPFTNKEQKILLLAKEEESQEQILDSIMQILNNCIVGDGVDPYSLAIFDIEDLFMRIRAKSVGEIIDAKYTYRYENEDGTEKSDFIIVKINIDDIKVEQGEGHEKDIVIDEINKISMRMKYPSFQMVRDSETMGDMEMVASCIDIIYTEDEVYNPHDYTKEELEDFIDDIDAKGMLKIKKFFDTMPRLYYKTEVNKPKLGEKETLEFKGIRDFFI